MGEAFSHVIPFPMKRLSFPPVLPTLAAALLAAVCAVSCNVSSADSVSANATDPSGTSYDYSGRYVNADENGASIVSGATGGYGLSYLVLFQAGTSLNGRDSKGQHWDGNISSIASGGTAHFSLSGRMATGTGVNIVGTLSYDSGTGTMSASWIEPDMVGTVYASAAVSSSSSSTNTTNTTSTLSVSPTSASLSPSESQTFSASGGKSPYTWRVSGGGTINRSGGASVVYTAPASGGSATVTVSDGAGHSAVADIDIESGE